MRQRLHDLLRSPSFPGERKTRQADLLNLILLFSAVLTAISVFLQRFGTGTLWLIAFILATLYLRTLLSWGRVDSSATAGFTLVILVAALALGHRASLIYDERDRRGEKCGPHWPGLDHRPNCDRGRLP